MPSLDQIQQEILNVLTAEEGADDPEFQALAAEYLDELASQEADKVDGLAFVVRKLEAEADFLKAEEARAAAKRRSIEANKDRLKQWTIRTMDRHGLTKLKGHLSSMSIRSTTSIHVGDIDHIPQECIREKVVREPDKKLLKEYLESGMQIPGATIVHGRSLVFR